MTISPIPADHPVYGPWHEALSFPDQSEDYAIAFTAGMIWERCSGNDDAQVFMVLLGAREITERIAKALRRSILWRDGEDGFAEVHLIALPIRAFDPVEQ